MLPTTVILDPGAGPSIDYHGDNVLIPSTGSKRQDVFTCSKEMQFVFAHLAEQQY